MQIRRVRSDTVESNSTLAGTKGLEQEMDQYIETIAAQLRTAHDVDEDADLANWRVFCDWLIDRGDPRGEYHQMSLESHRLVERRQVYRRRSRALHRWVVPAKHKREDKEIKAKLQTLKRRREALRPAIRAILSKEIGLIKNYTRHSKYGRFVSGYEGFPSAFSYWNPLSVKQIDKMLAPLSESVSGLLFSGIDASLNHNNDPVGMGRTFADIQNRAPGLVSRIVQLQVPELPSGTFSRLAQSVSGIRLLSTSIRHSQLDEYCAAVPSLPALTHLRIVYDRYDHEAVVSALPPNAHCLLFGFTRSGMAGSAYLDDAAIVASIEALIRQPRPPNLRYLELRNIRSGNTDLEYRLWTWLNEGRTIPGILYMGDNEINFGTEDDDDADGRNWTGEPDFYELDYPDEDAEDP